MLQQIATSLNISMEDIYIYFVLSPIIILWCWSIFWTLKDIINRTENLSYQMLCIILVALWGPFIGFPLYFIIRPSVLLSDRWWKESIQILSNQCMECDAYNDKDNMFCTECGAWLRIECKECGEKYYNGYNYCTKCGAPNLDID